MPAVTFPASEFSFMMLTESRRLPFDRLHIETKGVFCLMCAPNVEMTVAIGHVTLDSRQARLFADFANLLESFRGNKAHPFSIVKQLCIAELDLLGPKCTRDVDPVVPSRSF